MISLLHFLETEPAFAAASNGMLKRFKQLQQHFRLSEISFHQRSFANLFSAEIKETLKVLQIVRVIET